MQPARRQPVVDMALSGQGVVPAEALARTKALDRLRLERSLLVRETAMLRATTSRPAPDYVFEPFSQN